MTTRSYSLHYVDGSQTRVFSLRDRAFLVGSADGNDLIIADTVVSPTAMKIEPASGGYRCESLDGRPIRLNGQKVRLAMLKQGDTLEFDNNKLTVEIQENPARDTPDSSGTRLQRFIDAIGKERQIAPLLRKLVHLVMELTGGTDAFLFKLDAAGVPVLFESTRPSDTTKRFSDTIVQAVICQKAGIYIPNALTDPAFKNAASICDLRLHSVVCAPMLSAGKLNGLVYVGSHNPAVSFTPMDLENVTVYAAIAGMLMRHVDYITEQNQTIRRLSSAALTDGLIASSPAMRPVISMIQAVAASDITVLLTGETGTGKSRIAHAVHSQSARAPRPFIIVNCSSIRGELLESELFGHKKGSFTGAVTDHEGLFAAATGGTIFLDEISEIEAPLQAKLLRAIETKSIRPIGSTQEIAIDARIICASNRDLPSMVRERTFREDLYYRINQIEIALPPLRERDEDIVLLAYLFLDRYKAEYPDKEIFDFHPATLKTISAYRWPGNIRELTNTIHRAVLMSSGPLLQFTPAVKRVEPPPQDFESAMRNFQRHYLMEAIGAAGGNKDIAAKSIGLSRSTFYRYLQESAM